MPSLPAIGFAKALLEKHGGSYVHAAHEAYHSYDASGGLNAKDIHSAINDLATKAGFDPQDQLSPEAGGVPKNVLNYVTNHPDDNPLVDLSKIDPNIPASMALQDKLLKLKQLLTEQKEAAPQDEIYGHADEIDAELNKNAFGDDYGDDPVTGDPWIKDTASEPDIYYKPTHELFHPEEFYRAFAPEERKAVRGYVAASNDLNGALRQGLPETSIYPGVRSQIYGLDSVMKRARIAKPAVLYRGVTDGVWQRVFYNLKPGDQYTDRGFVSTTVDRSVAPMFASTTDNPAMIHIVAKPGDPGLAMGPYGLGNEQEVLLPRQTTFKILKVDHANKRIFAEIVGSPLAEEVNEPLRGSGGGRASDPGLRGEDSLPG